MGGGRPDLTELDRALSNEPLPARVVLVDDGSTRPMPEGFAQREFQALGCVEVLSLRRNLGRQRVIAIGLAFVHADRPCEIVVVMDRDGEDAPSDEPRFLAKLRGEGGARIIFAARTRRSENLVFRAGYQALKIVHLVLIGLQVKVGNFSAIPSLAQVPAPTSPHASLAAR
jgi:glycosyltransferase involved in cell wall biosynthesis